MIFSPLELPSKISDFREKLHLELKKLERAPNSVDLVLVTKTQPLDLIITAINSDIKHIGENYVKEAKDKFEFLPPVEKHFLGHIQINKAKSIVKLFDMVQSVDRIEAATALGQAAKLQEKILPVLIQLNIANDERYGCKPENIYDLVESIYAQSHLRLKGVMAIGPKTSDKNEIIDSFAIAATINKDLKTPILSLGMSHDWKLALQVGSNMIRIGTAIFGARG